MFQVGSGCLLSWWVHWVICGNFGAGPWNGAEPYAVHFLWDTRHANQEWILQHWLWAWRTCKLPHCIVGLWALKRPYVHGGVLDEPLLHWLGKTWVCCKLRLGSAGTVGLGCGGICFVVWSSPKQSVHFMELLALPVNMLIGDESIFDQVRAFFVLPFDGMTCHKQPTHSLQICGNSPWWLTLGAEMDGIQTSTIDSLDLDTKRGSAHLIVNTWMPWAA